MTRMNCALKNKQQHSLGGRKIDFWYTLLENNNTHLVAKKYTFGYKHTAQNELCCDTIHFAPENILCNLSKLVQSAGKDHL